MRRMWRLVVFILVFLSVVVLILRFGAKPFSEMLGIRDRTGIRIEASPVAEVSIDQKLVGKTPYESDQLSVGEHLVSLKAVDDGGKEMSWQANVPLNSGTVTVVNRELAQTEATSSGEVITLEKGVGAIIISTPDQADVNVDGKNVGKTPLRLDSLAVGEHVFILGRSNYLKRSIKAATIDGYRLSMNVDLALSEADLTQVNTQPLQASMQVVIKSTPTGFLRVRKEPSTDADEVGRVKPGEVVTLLEEVPGWFRIRLTDNSEGYISSAYATKK